MQVPLLETKRPDAEEEERRNFINKLGWLHPGLFHSPETRQGLKSLSYSPSRLKTTQILIYSRL